MIPILPTTTDKPTLDKPLINKSEFEYLTNNKYHKKHDLYNNKKRKPITPKKIYTFNKKQLTVAIYNITHMY